MHRLHIFIASDDQPDTPEAQAAFDKILDERPGAEPILTNIADYTGEMPKAGDRPVREYKTDPDQADPLFPGSSTHSRAGGWVVVGQPDVFPSDLPIAREYDEVVIAWCVFEPLPEAENPWLPVHRPVPSVTLDSFGGDEQAYKDWLASDHGKAVTERESRTT